MKENEHFNEQLNKVGRIRKCRLREARQRIPGDPVAQRGSGSEALST